MTPKTKTQPTHYLKISQAGRVTEEALRDPAAEVVIAVEGKTIETTLAEVDRLELIRAEKTALMVSLTGRASFYVCRQGDAISIAERTWLIEELQAFVLATPAKPPEPEPERKDQFVVEFEAPLPPNTGVTVYTDADGALLLEKVKKIRRGTGAPGLGVVVPPADGTVAGPVEPFPAVDPYYT